MPEDLASNPSRGRNVSVTIVSYRNKHMSLQMRFHDILFILTEGISSSWLMNIKTLHSWSYRRRKRSMEFPESGYCPAISASF